MRTLRDIQAAHARRNSAYPTCAEWSLADWGNALAGETGEACNIVKKIRRGDGAGPAGKLELLSKLAAELGDVIAYACLLAEHAGIDLELAHAAKFNVVNRRIGWEEDL